MTTVLLLVGFALAVVALLVVTPALERWATGDPAPVEPPAEVGEPLDAASTA